jgi:hypothetical protein
MTGLSDDRVRELLRSIRPEGAKDVPARDLWPRVRAGVDDPSPRLAATDWLLLAALALVGLVQPSSLRMLLFHF